MVADSYKLFRDFCPIFYFHKDEPYMPADMSDILRISNVTPAEVNQVKLVNIPRASRFDHSIGKQILCKTEGEFTLSGITYIDLVYIVTFTWNGTLAEHAFDKEEVVVRLQKTRKQGYEVTRVFGSSHGNGMWFRVYKKEVEFREGRPVMYSANESHAMYNRPMTHKRLFGFGDDVMGRHQEWDPTEFVIFTPGNRVRVYGMTGLLTDKNTEHFATKTRFGNEKNNQPWPGGLHYDTVNLDGFYKYDGGIDNLFNGKSKQVPTWARILLRVLSLGTWVSLITYILYLDVKNYQDNKNTIKFTLTYNKKDKTTKTYVIRANENTVKKLIAVIAVHLLIIAGLFITGSILGLDLLVLSPIY